MKKSKKEALEARGWKIGSVEEFLELSPEEVKYIEMKLELARQLKARRQKKRMTQVQLARKIASSQSRVAKMESGDASVTIDLIIRSLIALGASNEELARAITKAAKS